jgi:hypothetical protein
MAKAPLYSPGPSPESFAVTKSDSTNFGVESRYLYVGTSGDVVIVTRGGNTITYKNVPSGGYIWASCIRVNSTNTTATDIVAHP